METYRKPIQLDRERFSTEIDSKPVALYSLSNKSGISVQVINHGAKIVAITVPDKEGRPVDVVLGHDSIKDYQESEEQFFGAVCGRYANRIAKGRFSIDGTEYELAVNNGPNALHGGIKGFNDVVWTVVEHNDLMLKLSYLSKDGEEGYPGNLKVTVTYRLEEDHNALNIKYEAETDKATVLNLTNHTYFNLSGEGDLSVHDHILRINSRSYLPTDNTSIPYGDPEDVTGTPFDFIEDHDIGERIDNEMEQLVWARGYDHTYIIDKPIDDMGLCAVCSSPKSGIQMSVWSDQPGMQLYTGNWMSGNMRGKGDSRYPARSAVCFETQHYPDSPNKPEYPSTLLRPGEKFESETVFTFDITE